MSMVARMVLRRNEGAARLAALAAVLSLLLSGCASTSARPPREAFNLGLSFERQGKPWEAIVQYREALQAEPKNVEIRLRLADLLQETRDYRSAERNYRTVLEYDPENAAAVNNLCWLYTVTGWHLEWAQKAMKSLLEGASPYRHAYLDTLGMIQFRLGAYHEARSSFDEAAELCRKGTVMSTSEECEQINQHLRMAKARE